MNFFFFFLSLYETWNFRSNEVKVARDTIADFQRKDTINWIKKDDTEFDEYKFDIIIIWDSRKLRTSKLVSEIRYVENKYTFYPLDIKSLQFVQTNNSPFFFPLDTREN